MKIIIIITFLTIFFNSAFAQLDVRAIRKEETEKNRLLITVNGKEIEVAKEDLLKMTWQDAKDACKKLGAGWRLPTKDELEQMHVQLQKNGKGNFESDTPYWSSSEYDEERAWFFFFLYGSAAHNPKNASPFNVRAVREIDANIDMPIIISINGKKLEIAKEDLGEMIWQDAKDACNKLGAGWRLPAKDELEQIYQQLYKKGMCNFKSANYWSGTENGEIPAWAFTFANGFAFSNYKNYLYYVRAVRSL